MNNIGIADGTELIHSSLMLLLAWTWT